MARLERVGCFNDLQADKLQALSRVASVDGAKRDTEIPFEIVKPDVICLLNISARTHEFIGRESVAGPIFVWIARTATCQKCGIPETGCCASDREYASPARPSSRMYRYTSYRA